MGTTSSVGLHICAVTYMTEIPLHVTLNTNKHNSLIISDVHLNSWRKFGGSNLNRLYGV